VGTHLPVAHHTPASGNVQLPAPIPVLLCTSHDSPWLHLSKIHQARYGFPYTPGDGPTPESGVPIGGYFPVHLP